MDQIIKKNGKKEFIHFDSLIITDNIKDRIRYYHFIVSRKEIINCVNKLIIWLQKKMHVNRIKNLDLQIMKGCNWFSITEECAKYVLQKENETKKMFRFSCCGDELFLQTIVYNSKFRSNISIHNYQDNYECCLRLIDWKRGYPYTFRSQDFQSLINSECLFARKFDYLSYPDVIDDLFKYLLNKKKK